MLMREYTLDWYGGPRNWFIMSCESRAQAIKAAIKHMRQRGGRARVFIGGHLVWKRGRADVD